MKIIKLAKGKIPGSTVDKKGLKPKDFDPKLLAEGADIEMEHTTDRKIAEEIAMAHLNESLDYYKKLKKYVE